MSPKSPLPARILIPVANPGTAEELIRLGAAMLDPRQGELTALGIVEVPEGMPLSEGATRARHARRLLQKVLDYAPQGTAIHPIVRIGRHAAEGIIEASAEQEADLIIFGWGGRNPPGTERANGPIVFSPTIDEVVRESPADIAVVKQRGSRDIRRVLVPVRGGPHAELAVRYADAIATHHGATVVVLHLVPPGITMAVRAQAERALAAFIRQHLHGSGEGVLREAPNVRNAILREAEKADLVVMGASAVPGGDGDQTYLFGALPEAVAARAKPSVVVVKTRRSIGGGTFDALASRAETLAAADRAAEEARAIPTRVERWFGESNFHHAEFSDLRRLVQLKDKQGVTISLVLPTLDEEETIGPIVRRAFREMVGRVPCSTRSSSSTRHRATGRARSPRPRGRASSSIPTCCRDTARSVARARPSGSRSSRRPATSSCGPTPTSAIGTRGWSTARSVPCSTSHASSTSRATTNAPSSWTASSRKVAADASPSSSRGRSSTSSTPSSRA